MQNSLTPALSQREREKNLPDLLQPRQVWGKGTVDIEKRDFHDL